MKKEAQSVLVPQEIFQPKYFRPATQLQTLIINQVSFSQILLHCDPLGYATFENKPKNEKDKREAREYETRDVHAELEPFSLKPTLSKVSVSIGNLTESVGEEYHQVQKEGEGPAGFLVDCEHIDGGELEGSVGTLLEVLVFFYHVEELLKVGHELLARVL